MNPDDSAHEVNCVAILFELKPNHRELFADGFLYEVCLATVLLSLVA